MYFFLFVSFDFEQQHSRLLKFFCSSIVVLLSKYIICSTSLEVGYLVAFRATQSLGADPGNRHVFLGRETETYSKGRQDFQRVKIILKIIPIYTCEGMCWMDLLDAMAVCLGFPPPKSIYCAHNNMLPEINCLENPRLPPKTWACHTKS